MRSSREQLRAIWDADQEAFEDHWGASQPSEEDWLEFSSSPHLDPTLWRVAWAGHQVAGQVRSFINAEENRRYGRRRGWVEHISVRRPWRHRGLARALMAASFPLLRARGMTEGALHVDAENLSGALRVYESMGFSPVSRETVYRKPLALGEAVVQLVGGPGATRGLERASPRDAREAGCPAALDDRPRPA